MWYPNGSDDEINAFIKLGLLVFWLSIILATITFPFSVFVYYRILTNESFKGSYIYKMIAFNGFTSFFHFFTYILVVHLGAIPDIDPYFDFIIDNGMGPLYGFIFLSSAPMHFSSSMFVAVNRLLSILRTNELRRIDALFFRGGVIFSVLAPLLVASPHLFSTGHYVAVKSPQNRTYHIPQSESYLLIPWLVYLIAVALVSNLATVLLILQLTRVRRRKRVTDQNGVTKMVSRVEQGLIATVTSQSVIQFMNLIVGMMAANYDALIVGIYLPLIIFLHTGSSFWLMLSFVPSVRKCILPKSMQLRLATSGNHSTVRVQSKPSTPIKK